MLWKQVASILSLTVCLLAASVTAAHAQNPAGLLSWWPADGSADDVQGGNNGALSDGATYEAGAIGQAFRFDGTSW